MRALTCSKPWAVAGLLAGALLLVPAESSGAAPVSSFWVQATSMGYFTDAYKRFEKAMGMPPGPSRNQTFREAAELYKAALELAPSRDEAPEAAFNASYGYKQAGDPANAAEVLGLFLKEYGKEDILAKLEKGDPTVSPARPPD